MVMKGASTETPNYLGPDWNYAPSPRFYDEFLGSDQQIRPHWTALAESLAAMGHAGLARRWQQGRRLIHENGITYNVYSDPQNTWRPWTLDPFPLLMNPADRKAIESAMIQRAMLFNAILADLY